MRRITSPRHALSSVVICLAFSIIQNNLAFADFFRTKSMAHVHRVKGLVDAHKFGAEQLRGRNSKTHVNHGMSAQKLRKPIRPTKLNVAMLHILAQEADDQSMELFLNAPDFPTRAVLVHRIVNAQMNDGFSPLHRAVLRAKPEHILDETMNRSRIRTIQLLLQKFANPRLREHSREFSPFHLAALFSTQAIAKLLLDHDGECRQQIKMQRERLEINGEILAEKFYNMKLDDYDDEIASEPLINSRNKDGNTVLILLAKLPHSLQSKARILEMVSFLLAQQPPADAFLRNKKGKSAILIAIERGNAEMLKLLLDSVKHRSNKPDLLSFLRNISLNDKSANLLHLWAQDANKEMLTLLLNAPNFPHNMINALTEDGFSPLHHAVLYTHPKHTKKHAQTSRSRVRTIKLLLTKFANPRLRGSSHDLSAFHLAALVSPRAICKLLLDHDSKCRRLMELQRNCSEIGRDGLTETFSNMKLDDYDRDIASIPLINSRNKLGDTALILLAKCPADKFQDRNLKMTSFLLAQQPPADASLLNNEGESAISIAAGKCNAGMLKLLLESIKHLSDKKLVSSLLQNARQAAESCGRIQDMVELILGIEQEYCHDLRRRLRLSSPPMSSYESKLFCRTSKFHTLDKDALTVKGGA